MSHTTFYVADQTVKTLAASLLHLTRFNARFISLLRAHHVKSALKIQDPHAKGTSLTEDCNRALYSQSVGSVVLLRVRS